MTRTKIDSRRSNSFSAIWVLGFLLIFGARALLAAPPTATRKSNVATPRSGAKKVAASAKNASKAKTVNKNAALRAVDSQSTLTAFLRARPQLALFAGALGALALAVGLAAATRPHRAHSEESPVLQEADEVARLQISLDYERASRKEHEEMFWKMAMDSQDILFVMSPRLGTVEWYGPIDASLGYSLNSFPRTVEGWAENIHPQETENVVAAYTRSCRGEGPLNIEYSIRRRNGTYREWSHRGRPLFDERHNLVSFIGSCTDVTERNQTQRQLRENEELLAHMAQISDNAILICDLKGEITFANRTAQTLFCASPEELLGAPYSSEKWQFGDARGAPLPTEEMPLSRVLRAGNDNEAIEYSMERGGETVWFSLRGAPLHNDQNEVGGAIFSLLEKPEFQTHENVAAWQNLRDPLTGLANRALFHDRLEHALLRAERTKTRVALLSLDLDDFSVVNESLGREIGDEVLRTAARRLSDLLRASDTAARLSRDEFAILLENIPQQDSAQIIVDRVLETLTQPFIVGEQRIFAPPRIGAALSAPCCTPEELLSWADNALHAAKRQEVARAQWHTLPAEESSTRTSEESSIQTQDADADSTLSPEKTADFDLSNPHENDTITLENSSEHETESHKIAVDQSSSAEMSPGETQNAAIEKIPAVHVQTELSPPEKTLVSAPIAEAKAPFLNSDEPDLGAPIGVSSYEGAPELKAIPISPTHAQNGQAENNGARESDDSESLLDGEEASLLPPRLLRKA